jgi:hypothetical protein
MGENGEESIWRQLSPRRGDGIGGTVEFSVKGGAPRVGAVKKATEKGFALGVLRSEDGGGEKNRGAAASVAPFYGGPVARQKERGRAVRCRPRHGSDGRGDGLRLRAGEVDRGRAPGRGPARWEKGRGAGGELRPHGAGGGSGADQGTGAAGAMMVYDQEQGRSIGARRLVVGRPDGRRKWAWPN